MLTYIHIKNFMIVSELALDLSTGLTVLTGETGAGKSILMDALALATGGRADSKVIRTECSRCEVTAIFDISRMPEAVAWLEAQAFEPNTTCILHRVLTDDGRSRSSVNGRHLPLQSVRELAERLINICSQNHYQTLLRREQPLLLLDAYANNESLRGDLKKTYTQWQKANHELIELQNLNNDKNHRLELVHFYVQELDTLNLEKVNFSAINQRYEQLKQAENHLATYQELSQQLKNTVMDSLYQSIKKLTSIKNPDKHTTSVIDLLHHALIYIGEAMQSLRSTLNELEINPTELAELEEKINTFHALARKHHVHVEDLPQCYRALCEEFKSIHKSEQDLDNLTLQVKTLSEDYAKKAKQLTNQRQQAAKKLGVLITEQIKRLGMHQAEFTVQLLPHSSPSAMGMEHVEFLVSMNPGQPLQPLSKTASGGELSRVALAIQVIMQSKQMTATMVFDEVDIGIGGSTAEMVGQLLRKLAKNNQVLCITHLPQVAAQGHQHVQIKKIIEDKTTFTTVSVLNTTEKIQEIARMLGGVKITEQTIAHAQSMLDSVV